MRTSARAKRHHDFNLLAGQCERCGVLMFEWVDLRMPRCGRRRNRKQRKRSVRWWRDFARILWLKPEEIRYEERLRIQGKTALSEYLRISNERREEFERRRAA